MAISGSSTAVGVAPEWETFAGDGVTLRAPAGSVAARRAPDLQRQAVRAIYALADLLDVDDAKRR
jgi:hypothetical protein